MTQSYEVYGSGEPAPGARAEEAAGSADPGGWQVVVEHLEHVWPAEHSAWVVRTMGGLHPDLADAIDAARSHAVEYEPRGMGQADRRHLFEDGDRGYLTVLQRGGKEQSFRTRVVRYVGTLTAEDAS